MTRDDRWEGEEGETHASKRSKMSSGALPTINGAGPMPPPPAATKSSRLKPPTQRVMLMPGGGVVRASAMDSSGSPGKGAPSPLKLPMLVKPSTKKPEETEEQKKASTSNQEAEESISGSSRSLKGSGPRGSIVDKNQDFIRRLEEQKKKEKEEQMKLELKKKKMQKRRTERILEEAALARQRQAEEAHEEHAPEQDAPVEESIQVEEEDPVEAEERRAKEKEAKRQRKRLLKKQQQLLEKLQAMKKEKQDEEEIEREKERRRQEKLKKAVLDGIHASHAEEVVEEEVPEEPPTRAAKSEEDSPAKSVPEEEEEEEDPTPHTRKHSNIKSKKTKAKPEVAQDREIPCPGPSPSTALLPPASAPTNVEEPPEDKQRSKEHRDAVHRKQQEYLTRLAEQRRQKQKEEEDAKLLLKKKRRRVQLAAQQRLQEAAAKLKLQQEAQLAEQQAAAEAAAASAPSTVVDVDAMVARLSKLKEKDMNVVPEARDFASWKKRHGVRSDQKVFCLTGWYPMIKEELEKRGWFHNTSSDRTSPFFDLKWSLKSDDLKGTKLKEDQYVNHFFSNTAITTKVGLLHTLRGLTWHQHVDIDTVFPRAYDLNEPRDMDAFIMDFRYTFAEGLLKELAKRILRKEPVQVNEAFVHVLTSIARKRLRTKRVDLSVDALEESVDDVLSVGVDESVTELEWEVLTKCQIDAPSKFRASLAYRKKLYVDDKDPTGVLDGGQPAPMQPAVDTVLSALEKKQQRQLEKQRADAFQREKQRLSEFLERVSTLSTTTRDDIVKFVLELEKACPQFHLNGGGDLFPSSNSVPSISRNVWIVKPAGLSRGRGIRVFNQLDALLEYADVVNHKECQWVAQKYIENPLLIAKRKFDIRQWVLVTGWDPLTVWIYDDFYLRFSSEEYSTKDLSDQYVHLTNNSIQKYSDKFEDVYTTEGGVKIEGNMLHSDEFKVYIQAQMGVDEAAFERGLQARMKEMVVQSLQCAQDMIQHRKNGCELYGYDFMLDETLRPWLIEVNSSPACDYSTPTAKRYVETGLAGIVKVIVDHREFEARKKSGGVEGEPDTGRWRRIHKAEYIGKPVSSFGADFQIKGVKVNKSKAKKSTGAAVVAKVATPLAEETEDGIKSGPEEHEEEDGEVDQGPGDREDVEEEVAKASLHPHEVAVGDEDGSIDSLL